MKHPTKNISLNCPPGTFRGKFLGHAYQGIEGGQSEFRVRLLFEVMELSDQNTSILVAHDFGLSDQPGSPLMNFLRNWLGPACTGKQLNTARFNLRRLKHRECELVVRYVYSPCQPEPIVHLLHVQPPTRRPNPAATHLLTTLPILRQTPTTATTPDPAKAAVTITVQIQSPANLRVVLIDATPRQSAETAGKTGTYDEVGVEVRYCVTDSESPIVANRTTQSTPA